MKKSHLFSACAVGMALAAGAGGFIIKASDQQPYYEVKTLDSRLSSFSYRPGEVIVKLKGNSAAKKIRKVNGKVTATSSGLNELLTKYGVIDADPLMPLSGDKVSAKHARAINGKEVIDTDLSGLYAFKFDAKKAENIHSVIAELNELDDVEYAEPNYILQTLATGESDYTSDPLYSQQWGIPAIGADKLRGVPTISEKRPIIAILDTGVDIEHPDLKANIWTNSAEESGAEDADDDQNGYADDIHGWDFVNQSARMRDNNGHGTHCAGIAAACGGNGIGITGANPDALIMPITVMQSDGTGDVATIIKGVDYARANGADILSMSFGSYADSQAFRDALGKAYQNAVLVAAAGNDNKCIYSHTCPVNKMNGAAMFPAAYSFVLGVEASENAGGNLAYFSNFDEDGPVYTAFDGQDLFNYELRAPGTTIMSTFPNGQYRALNGTSMACPLVAGSLSRLISVKEISSKEELFGDLINTAKGNVDIFAAYGLTEENRKPTLSLVTYRLDDEKMGDGDGRPDAGETIRLYPTFRNTWGNARNITYSIKLAETEDPNIVEFMDAEGTHMISNLSSYATAEAENPFILKISPDCVDGRHICFVLTATCDNISQPLEQEIVLTAENGIELGGLLEHDMTLTPDKNYIVTSMLGVPSGVTLTIMPGTTIKFKDGSGFTAMGNVIAKGEPNNMICFTKANLDQGIVKSFVFNNTYSNDYIEYVKIHDLQSSDGIDHSKFKNSIICNSVCLLNHSQFENGNIYNGNLMHSSTSPFYAWNSNIILNQTDTQYAPRLDVIKNSNVFSNIRETNVDGITQRTYISGQYSSPAPDIYYPENPNYLGSANLDIVKSNVLDIRNPLSHSFGQYDLSNMLTRPVHDAHGIVWKVVVNDYDAQDEYELLPPLGVGKHKFEVYFNRQMNHDATPMIAMGVRAPFTQTSIAEEGSWRTEYFDGEAVDIYIAYLTIKGKDNFDGVNTIYVAEAEDDEFFPIPIEDVRFHVNVQSAGSMSEGFSAEPGLGKVNLTWENPEANFDDMLGYNMYRYEIVDESTETAPVRINENLLTEESFTDFDVIPGHRYCYHYKVMRTDLQENAPSKTVAATPLTAAKGDADGSMKVDVADVVTEVNHITGNNPQPFIFEAADVNDDLSVDILDIVGTVNIIMRPDAKPVAAMENNSSATYSVQNGILYVDTPVELGGLQFSFNAEADAEIKPLEALEGMETAGSRINDSEYRFIAFSFSGKTLAPGRHALLSIGESTVSEIILSDTKGKKVLAINGTSGISSVMKSQMNVVTPNPFNDHLNVPVAIGAEGQHNVRLMLVAPDGSMRLSTTRQLGYGEHNVLLDTSSVGKGFYLLTMQVDGTNVQTVKVIKK